jgi:DNA polymerase-4/DNA polymerase IV (DinB-like DNA polymerase)
MSAKLASEEKKPDGFFEIPTPEFLRDLIIDRNVRIVYGIGAQTADQLQKIGINTVRDIYNNKTRIENLLGSHGRLIIELAEGIDNRVVARQPKSKSLGKEITFQHDTLDFDYLKDVLRLLAKELSFDIRSKGIFCRTVTLKITYGDMKKITRSRSGDATSKANDIYTTAATLLDTIEKRAVRLVGISLSGFTDVDARQLSLFTTKQDLLSDKLDKAMLKLQHKYGADIIKTGSELDAEKKLAWDKSNLENEFNKG